MDCEVQTTNLRAKIGNFCLTTKGYAEKEIAEYVGVHVTTIYREINRNSTPSGKYIYQKAHEATLARRKRTTTNAKLDPILCWHIRQILQEEQWSPRQISGALALEGIKVYHQSIYNIIYADKSGNLRQCTRHKLKYRRHYCYKKYPIANRVSIHHRPKEADGTRFGDFEMDLIVDSFGHAILTLTERLTNMIFIEKLKDGKKAEGVVKAVRRLLLPYKDKVLTITADNGPEFAEHLKITQWLVAKVYFADPYSSWQKGAIENANKLIRQYIPKRANFNDYTEKRIKGIQHKLNSRPRQKLNFSTPKVEFYKRIN